MASKNFVFDTEQMCCVDDISNLILWLNQMSETAEIEKNNTIVRKYHIIIQELK